MRSDREIVRNERKGGRAIRKLIEESFSVPFLPVSFQLTLPFPVAFAEIDWSRPTKPGKLPPRLRQRRLLEVLEGQTTKTTES